MAETWRPERPRRRYSIFGRSFGAVDMMSALCSCSIGCCSGVSSFSSRSWCWAVSIEIVVVQLKVYETESIMEEQDEWGRRGDLYLIEAVAGISLLAQLPSGKLDRVNARRWSQPGCRHGLYPAITPCEGGGKLSLSHRRTSWALQGFQLMLKISKRMC